MALNATRFVENDIQYVIGDEDDNRVKNFDTRRDQVLTGNEGADSFRFAAGDSDDGLYLVAGQESKGGNATITDLNFGEGDTLILRHWAHDDLRDPNDWQLIVESVAELQDLIDGLNSDTKSDFTGTRNGDPAELVDVTKAFINDDGKLELRIADNNGGAQGANFEQIIIENVGGLSGTGVTKLCVEDVQYVIGDDGDNRIKNYDTRKDQVLTGNEGADSFRFAAGDSDDGLYLVAGQESKGGNATITDLNFGEGDTLILRHWAHNALRDPNDWQLIVESVAELQDLIDGLNSDTKSDFTGTRNGDPAELKDVTKAFINDDGNLELRIADNNGGAQGANFEQIIIENVGGLSGTGVTKLCVEDVQYVIGDNGDNRITNFDTRKDQVLTGNEGADRFVFSRGNSDDGLYLESGRESQGGNATITDLNFGEGDTIVFFDWKHADLRDAGDNKLTIDSAAELTALIEALNTDTADDFFGTAQDASTLLDDTKAFADGDDLVLQVADNQGGAQGANFEQIVIEDYGYLLTV